MSRATKWMDMIHILVMFLIFSTSTGSNIVITNNTMICDDARLRCAYRTGCGNALQYYLTRCASVLQGDTQECPESCQHALIALTSTDEGKELMTCECVKDDKICIISKQRVEICRSSVIMAMNKTRVSCRIATWICHADTMCSTALSYYNFYCRSMFHGRKCTHRCRNSINILQRQEKATKLNSCLCDGAEEYDCQGIHRNMYNLCFKNKSKILFEEVAGNMKTNEILKDCSEVENGGVQIRIDMTMLLTTIFFFLIVTKD